MSVTAAMPFHFSSPEYLSHHRPRKNRLSPVNRASPAHMNSPLHINIKKLHNDNRQRQNRQNMSTEIPLSNHPHPLSNKPLSKGAGKNKPPGKIIDKIQ